MYKIIDGKSTGKTSRLLLLAKETGATIACNDPHKLMEKAKYYGIEGVRIIGYKDLMVNILDGEERERTDILIDELAAFVWQLLGSNSNYGLAGYTLSNE